MLFFTQLSYHLMCKLLKKSYMLSIVYISQTLYLIFSPFIYSFTLKHCVFGAKNHGRGCPGVKPMFLELGRYNFFDFWSSSNELPTLPYKQNELNFLKVFARFSAFLKNWHFKYVLDNKLSTFCNWQFFIKTLKKSKIWMIEVTK